MAVGSGPSLFSAPGSFLGFLESFGGQRLTPRAGLWSLPGFGTQIFRELAGGLPGQIGLQRDASSLSRKPWLPACWGRSHPSEPAVSSISQVSSACLSPCSSPFLTFSTEEFPVPVQISEEEAIDESGFPQTRLS